jgi:hypothetical protein
MNAIAIATAELQLQLFVIGRKVVALILRSA